MTRAIKSYSRMDEKVNELILVGIFTAHGAMRGLLTHIERALSHGAVKEEIFSSILLALPVVGVTTTNLAMETATQFFKDRKSENC